jgi:hypothetical protein
MLPQAVKLATLPERTQPLSKVEVFSFSCSSISFDPAVSALCPALLLLLLLLSSAIFLAANNTTIITTITFL